MHRRSSSNMRCCTLVPVVRNMSSRDVDQLYLRINMFALMLLCWVYVMLHWAAFFYVVVGVSCPLAVK